MMMETPVMEKTGAWRRCGEVMPEPEHLVLAACWDGDMARVELCYWRGVWMKETGESVEGEVYAWMPLPEPPEREES